MDKIQKFTKAGCGTRLPTRRLISTVACAFAMLVWATEPALAAYKGRLPSGDPLTVEIGTLPGNAGPTAVRVTYLSKRGERVEFGTVPAGSDAKVVDEQPIPRGTKLIIVEIDNPVGGGALLRVIDALGSYIYDEAVLFDDRYVYEVFDY